MAKRPRANKLKNIRYFFLNEKIHKVLRGSRAKDELIAWCYPDKKRMLYSYAQVEKYMSRAYTINEVAELLNKHKITIEDYILEGKIKYPQKVYPIGNPESDWYKFMYSESDIMDIHQFILESGYSKNMPSKTELRALLKHNLILYTKTDTGFVPVWKAD